MTNQKWQPKFVGGEQVRFAWHVFSGTICGVDFNSDGLVSQAASTPPVEGGKRRLVVQARKVGITQATAWRIPIFHVRRRVQRRIHCEALDQIRITDKRPAESNQIGMAFGDSSFRTELVVTAVTHQRTVK